MTEGTLIGSRLENRTRPHNETGDLVTPTPSLHDFLRECVTAHLHHPRVDSGSSV